MTFTATAEPERFDDAVDWFGQRIPLTEELADQLGDYSGPRAWTIAGVAQLEVVDEVHQSLLSAIEKGTPFAEWQASIEAKLTKAWGGPNAHRLETVFRNATSQAYNAGRWRQINDPEVRAARPFLFFDGVIDSRTSDICRAWDGTTRPIDDPIWQTASPQLHHRCRSQLRTLTERQANARGITEQTPSDPDVQPQAGFGLTPTESEWKPNPTDYSSDNFNEYQSKRDALAQDAARSIPQPSE